MKIELVTNGDNLAIGLMVCPETDVETQLLVEMFGGKGLTGFIKRGDTPSDVIGLKVMPARTEAGSVMRSVSSQEGGRGA